MTTYLSQLDDYLYVYIYGYVRNNVMISLLDDYRHLKDFIDIFYSTDSQYHIYRLLDHPDANHWRLNFIHKRQINNGKMRRGSTRLIELLHDDLHQINILAVHQDPSLYHKRLKTVFRTRHGSLPPIVGHFISILLTLNVPRGSFQYELMGIHWDHEL